MIENRTQTEIYSTGKSKEMGMILNEKAYSILSDGLYSNKQRAAAREYITNAYDSHVMSGKKDIPFRVHCPTELEPFFEVQDFGTGLDEDEMETIYSTYFLSNKETSNESMGCKGLGSKSGLAVSDSFTVTSIKGGNKVTFSFHKGRDGKPCSKKVFDNKTDEGNGVIVRIPVKPQDCSRWKKEISELICPFDYVDCNIEKDSFYKDRLETLKGMEYGLLNWDDKGGVHEVLMGGVIYPIKDFCDYIKTENLRKKFHHVARDNYILLKAPLGDLDVAPSREALSMDNITTKNLTKLINKFVIGLIRNAKEDYKHVNFNSYWSLRNAFYGSGLWYSVAELPLIGGKHTLYDLDQNNTWVKSNSVKVIPFDFTIKGYREGKTNFSNYVYSGSCQHDTARVVKKVSKPKVFYGEIYKPSITLWEAHKHYKGSVFHVEDLEDAKLLAEYYCTEVVGTLEEFFPDKPERKPRVSREKFGSLDDRYCLARYVAEGVEYSQDKVDLQEEGVCYVEGTYLKEDLPFKYCSGWSSNTLSEILLELGYSKIVMKNQINGRKIEKAAIPCAAELLTGYVSNNKVKLLKSLARKWITFNEYLGDEYLNTKCKSFKKLKAIKDEDLGLLNFSIEPSYFDLENSKLFKKEKLRVEKLQNSYEDEYQALKSNLQLLSSLHSEDDIVYYLKLEKIIK